MQAHLAPSIASQSAFPLHFLEAPGEEKASHSSNITWNRNAAKPLDGPPGDPDDKPDNKKRNKMIDIKRKDKFLIDSTALKADMGRSRGNMKCEVNHFERRTKLTIND